MEQRRSKLLKERPFTMSVSGHQHYQRHLYLDQEDGWEGEKPHHHVINVTASGSWWRGMKKFGDTPHAYSGMASPMATPSLRSMEINMHFSSRQLTVRQITKCTFRAVQYSDEQAAFAYTNVFSGSEKTSDSLVEKSQGEAYEA